MVQYNFLTSSRRSSPFHRWRKRRWAQEQDLGGSAGSWVENWMDLENMDANIYTHIYIYRYILWHGNIVISILWLWDVMTCLVILSFCHKISHHLWWRRPVRSLVAERNCAFGLSFWSHILFWTILEQIYIFSHQSTQVLPANSHNIHIYIYTLYICIYVYMYIYN